VNLADVRATAMDEIARRDRIAARLDLANGLLVLDAALRRGEELLDAMDAPTTHALRDALRNVTYAHAGKRPDDTTRGISLTVYDASGKASAPASFLVDIVPVNNPAILDLNGAHRPGVDYAAVMGENERFLGVALADADAHVEDDDGRFIRGAFVLPSISRRSPCDRVRAVNAVPSGFIFFARDGFLFAHHPALLSIATRRDAFDELRLTPFDATPTFVAPRGQTPSRQQAAASTTTRTSPAPHFRTARANASR
jgi:hypothetical protein